MPHAHALEIGADMLGNAAQAVVTRVATAILDPKPPGREIEFIVEHDHVAGVQLVKAHGLGDGSSGVVHEGMRLQRKHLLAGNQPLGHFALKALAVGRKVMAADDFVHRHEADVMAIVGILGARIAESDQQSHR